MFIFAAVSSMPSFVDDMLSGSSQPYVVAPSIAVSFLLDLAPPPCSLAASIRVQMLWTVY